MARPASGYLRSLERMEQAVQEYLARLPDIVAVERRSQPTPLPDGLQRARAHLTRLEDTVTRSQGEAAVIEKLLQAEADAFSAWFESFLGVRARLETWTDASQSTT